MLLNLDISPADPRVRSADVTKGIPLPPNVCDAVYHSHVLEHLSAEEAKFFIAECYRDLKPAGILRVAVPDLERIARLYLQCLDSALAGEDPNNYDWMLLELYDQAARSTYGGEMAPHLTRASGEHRGFIRERIGFLADNAWSAVDHPRPTFPFVQRLRIAGARRLWFRLRLALATAAVTLLGGTKARNALREGVFRQSRETHQCMYDRFSLARLLSTSGFCDTRLLRPEESKGLRSRRYCWVPTGPRVCSADESALVASPATKMDRHRRHRKAGGPRDLRVECDAGGA